jgi:hypothetical protein
MWRKTSCSKTPQCSTILRFTVKMRIAFRWRSKIWSGRTPPGSRMARFSYQPVHGGDCCLRLDGRGDDPACPGQPDRGLRLHPSDWYRTPSGDCLRAVLSVQRSRTVSMCATTTATAFRRTRSVQPFWRTGCGQHFITMMRWSLDPRSPMSTLNSSGDRTAGEGAGHPQAGLRTGRLRVD